MKIVVFGPERRTGVLREQNVVDISLAFAKYLAEQENERHPVTLAAALAPADLARLIDGGARALDNVEKALDHLFQQAHDQRGPRGEDLIHPLADIVLHAPRPQGARIACAGGNFADHAAAMAEKMHGRPYEGDARAQIRNAGIWGFWKVGREVAGPDGDITYPRKATRLDYEGELAIVLGRRCLDTKAASAESCVWGITLLGDWSIRSPREPQGFHNFAMGKNFDTSCSLGPVIAVREAQPFAVDVETLVNGERRQLFNTRDMVFSFGDYIEYLSRDLTLYPGDIISGGTAAGTAADSSPLLPDGTSAPERYLKPGDTVEIRSPAVGSLRSRIVAKGNASTAAADRPGEFALIARYFAPLAQGFPGAWGLRDDAAVIAPAPGNELVAKTDAIVGGVHFLPDDPPGLIARKALRVNLSDLAAKGAVPRAYMLDLILPDAIGESWVAGFAAGLALDQREFGVHLIGGDTDRTPGPVTIAIMAFGEVAAGRIIRRGGARPGDGVFVTGTIGDAALGLSVLRGAVAGLTPEMAAFLADRYRLPRPRVTLGPRLIGLASAALDVSDGLVADLRHLCEASGLGAVVEAARVPLSAAAAAAIAGQPQRLAAALTGGDDYEIVFTAPPEAAAALAALAQQTGVPIAPIGRMVPVAAGAAPDVRVVDARGQPLTLAAEGWTHF